MYARCFADDIPESNRRDGSVMECDYGFIFLSNAAEYFEYFRLRAENRKKDAVKHLNNCLLRRRIENPRSLLSVPPPAPIRSPKPLSPSYIAWWMPLPVTNVSGS